METWIAAHPWVTSALGLALLIIPTLITGLTDYPRALVTHKDSPRSLKLPLTRSRRPESEPRPTEASGTVVVTPVLVLAVGWLCASFVSGCCKGPDCKPVKQQLIDCTSQTVRERGPQLFPIVADIVRTAAGDRWKSNLDALAANIGQYGLDIVTCLVHDVLERTAAKVGTVTPADPKEFAETENVFDRAPLYLKEKGFSR